MPELAALLAFQSMDSSKSLNFLPGYKMSPPEPCPGFLPSPNKTFMASSSITQFAGIFSPLQRLQPSKSFPLNINVQPSFFSFFVSLFTFLAVVGVAVAMMTAKVKIKKNTLFMIQILIPIDIGMSLIEI